MIGPFFSLNVLGYGAILALALTAWFLFRTKPGLALRAAGESPEVAHSLGLRVTRIRYAAVLFGGAMAGVAGCYYAVAQFKMWQEGLTAGNGWIALALVVFAAWRPWRMALGALLFGGVTGLGLYLQATGVHRLAFRAGKPALPCYDCGIGGGIREPAAAAPPCARGAGQAFLRRRLIFTEHP